MRCVMRAWVLLLLVMTGCATLVPREHAHELKLEPYGDAVEAQLAAAGRQAQLVEDFRNRTRDDVKGVFPEVKVKHREVPEGVTFSNGVMVAPVASGWEVVSAVHFTPRSASTIFPHEYAEKPLKCLCYWQVGLTWATAFAWQALVPLAWPCIAQSRVPLAEGYGYLRAAAEKSGASLVVLTELESDGADLYSASGFLLKQRPGVETPAPPSTGSPSDPP